MTDDCDVPGCDSAANLQYTHDGEKRCFDHLQAEMPDTASVDGELPCLVDADAALEALQCIYEAQDLLREGSRVSGEYSHERDMMDAAYLQLAGARVKLEDELEDGRLPDRLDGDRQVSEA